MQCGSALTNPEAFSVLAPTFQLSTNRILFRFPSHSPNVSSSRISRETPRSSTFAKSCLPERHASRMQRSKFWTLCTAVIVADHHLLCLGPLAAEAKSESSTPSASRQNKPATAQHPSRPETFGLREQNFEFQNVPGEYLEMAGITCRKNGVGLR